MKKKTFKGPLVGGKSLSWYHIVLHNEQVLSVPWHLILQCYKLFGMVKCDSKGCILFETTAEIGMSNWCQNRSIMSWLLYREGFCLFHWHTCRHPVHHPIPKVANCQDISVKKGLIFRFHFHSVLFMWNLTSVKSSILKWSIESRIKNSEIQYHGKYSTEAQKNCFLFVQKEKGD